MTNSFERVEISVLNQSLNTIRLLTSNIWMLNTKLMVINYRNNLENREVIALGWFQHL